MARGPAQIVANAAYLRLFWALANQGAINTIGASHTGGVTFNQALADQLGVAIKGAFTTHLGAHANANMVLVRVGIRSLSAANLQEWRDTGAAAAGAAVGDSLPVQTALCITGRTDQAGKSFRSRTYLGGFMEADSDVNGRATVALVNSCLAFMQAVRDALTAGGLTMAVISRPAFEQIIEKRTLVPGQADVVERISHSTAKAGGFRNINSLESRNTTFETQRRRNNLRGGVPTLLDPVAIIRFP